ncbi:hypothetical protein ACN268_25155 [Micromonospora sp. WMMD735]|uniref:hypothetical protein n=1 Tax=Micromonospora sp. WMMD735 TaxID=3404130 RepID=UPI003B93CA36
MATVSWLAIPSVDTPGGYGFVAADEVAGGARLGDIVRDRLYGREVNVAWGFYLAVFLMMALVLLLLQDVVRRADRHAAAVTG